MKIGELDPDSSKQPSVSNYHTGSRNDTVDFDNIR